MWTAENSQGAESLKIKWDIVPYTRGTGLDLGCGPVKPFPHFIGIDNNVDANIFNSEASARSLTANCEKLKIFANESMDFVFSSHLLEHIHDWEAALKEWWRVIKVGGYLVLYLPHASHYPRIGQPGSNPDHKHDFLPADITRGMEGAGCWDLAVNEDRNEGDEYSFFQVYRKEAQGHQESWKNARPDKKVAVIRYGAFGDCLQTASVLPGLKRAGYHVTFFCTPRGVDVIRHDPHIDNIVIQDEEQVPNHELSDYFQHLAKKFDKVVNMCETVEGVVLPMSKRAHFHWPKEARHTVCNVNYVELQHKIAGVPYTQPEVRFYPTEQEKAWALAEKAKCKGPVIAWALTGSAMHKIWPYVDAVIAAILKDHPQATIALLGANGEEALQGEWEEGPVWRRVGIWSIRESMSFAQVADVVVGPETGILNGMAMEPNRKVVILSHSTNENLTRDWVNTKAVEPVGVECYPCHRLHLDGWKYCNRHTEGLAVCQRSIGPYMVYDAMELGLEKQRIAA